MTAAIDFDPASGRCRVSRAVFEALADLARGVTLPAPLRDPLAAAELVTAGRIHPALAEPISRAADPEWRLTLFLTAHDGKPVRGSGWGSRGAGLLAMESADTRVDLLAVPPGFFPSALARIFEIGPRPRLAFRPVKAPHDLIEDLLSEHPRKRERASRYVAEVSEDPDTQRFASLLATGPWTWRNVRVEWPASDGTVAARALHIWDSADGMGILENRDDAVAVDPMDPSTLYLLLTRLLPRDSELLDLSQLAH